MEQIFCYLTETGNYGKFISLQEAAERCHITLTELIDSIKEFQEGGWNVFIDYDKLAANR